MIELAFARYFLCVGRPRRGVGARAATRAKARARLACAVPPPSQATRLQSAATTVAMLLAPLPLALALAKGALVEDRRGEGPPVGALAVRRGRLGLARPHELPPPGRQRREQARALGLEAADLRGEQQLRVLGAVEVQQRCVCFVPSAVSMVIMRRVDSCFDARPTERHPSYRCRPPNAPAPFSSHRGRR